MKKFMCVFVVIITMSMASCASEWVTYDYSDPQEKFKAEQMIKIPDDDRFEDFFECRVWARKRLLLGVVVPGTRQEYFEGYIAIPEDFDIYIFIYDLKGDYMNGDFTECKIIDFNDTPYDDFWDDPRFVGHYQIDKIQIKRK